MSLIFLLEGGNIMLDLSKFTQNYYSIKLADKTILKLKKPTQKMLKTMIEFQNVDDLDETEVFEMEKYEYRKLMTDLNEFVFA